MIDLYQEGIPALLLHRMRILYQFNTRYVRILVAFDAFNEILHLILCPYYVMRSCRHKPNFHLRSLQFFCTLHLTVYISSWWQAVSKLLWSLGRWLTGVLTMVHVPLSSWCYGQILLCGVYYLIQIQLLVLFWVLCQRFAPGVSESRIWDMSYLFVDYDTTIVPYGMHGT